LGNNGKVILAYSGGLDTSVCIRYLQTLHNLDVITVTVDCGQHDDFKEIERKARAIGAIKHVYIDAREEFARDYIVPSIKANGLYQGKYPLASRSCKEGRCNCDSPWMHR
jgi:argininosuccinate synthase